MDEAPAGIDVERLLGEAGWVHALVARLVGEREAADDLVQDTWVAALQSRSLAFRGQRGARAWPAAVARNLALRRRRQDAVRRHHETVRARRSSTEGGGDAVERLQLQRTLADALLGLDEPYRTAVIHHHLEGVPYATLAKQAGVSEAAARQRVSRGLAMLRARLDREYGGDRASWCVTLVDAFGPRVADLGQELWRGGLLMGAKTTLGAIGVLGAVAGLVVLVTQRPSVGGGERGVPGLPANAARTAEARPPVGDATDERSALEPATAAASGFGGRALVAEAHSAHGVRGASYALAITDTAGRPLGGAWVRSADDPPEKQLVADEQGLVRIPAPAEGATPVVVGCEGFLESATVLEPGEARTVVLAALPSLAGVVMDPERRAVATPGRVEIDLVSAQTGETEGFKAELDRTGRYRFEALPPGRVRWARALAAGWVEQELEPDLELQPDRSERLDLSVQAGGIVVGVVRDAQSEEPIPGAEVWSNDGFWHDDPLYPYAVADEDGRFRLEGVAVRRHEMEVGDGVEVGYALLRVAAEAEGHGPSPLRFFTLPWNEEARYEVDVFLDPTPCSIEGIVYEPGGDRPAGGVSIWSIDEFSNPRFVSTDEAGRFRFDDVPAGAFELLCRRGGLGGEGSFATARYSAQLEQGRTETCALELAPGSGRLTGTVVDPQGSPRSGALVRLRYYFRRGGLTIGGDGTEVATDERGRFEFAELPAGEYRVGAFGEGSDALCSRPDHRQLELGAGQEIAELDFVFGACSSFAGTVEAEGGTGALTVALVARGTGDVLREQRLTEDGTFRFEPILAGPYEIELRRGEEVLEVLPVGPGSAPDLWIFGRR